MTTAAIILVIGLFFLLAFWWLSRLHVYTELELRRHGGDDHFKVRVRLESLTLFRMEVPVAKLGLAFPPKMEVKMESQVKGFHKLREDIMHFESSWENILKGMRLGADVWQGRLSQAAREELPARQRFLLATLLGMRFKGESFRWVTRVGTGDPAFTAVAVGLFWGLVGTLMARVSRQVDLPSHGTVIKVLPAYNQPVFETEIKCILSQRVGYIIHAALENMHTLWEQGGRAHGYTASS